MENNMNVVTAPKTATFQMRINPEVRKTVEEIYAQSGMTLTDAINAFFQQSINVNGLPFLITPDSKEELRRQAVVRLMADLKKGEQSAASEDDLIEESDLLAELGVKL